MKNFLAELKRRNVYKVAVAYAIVAWLLIQAASILFPTYEAPAWVMKVFIAVIVLGFPVALVLAWAFEITPEGIVRAEDVSPSQSITHKTGRKLIGATIVLAVIAAGLFAFQMWRRAPGPRMEGGAPATPNSPAGAQRSTTDASSSGKESTTISEKSIAVLPFENLSSDKENAYFADGIQDEILTRLSKIGALKVISRTSTQKYKSAPDNLREIGKQLGVSNILEGSVQKAANAVHVNVQLIRAATDEHLWADSYNRKLDDIFGVEGEVAGAIADQLKATLSGSEKQELVAKPTTNPEAYDAYLRGLALAERPDLAMADQLAAIGSFETAVKLDPNFATAWASLSRVEGALIFNSDFTPGRRDAADKALQNAMRLQPNLVETRLAEAYFHYFVERDYVAARKIFEQIQDDSPNDSSAPLALALISRRQGLWQESLSHFAKAGDLDPRNLKVLFWSSDTYAATRQFASALKFIDRALDIAPNDNGAIARKALIYEALGDLAKASATLRQIHPDTADTVATFAPATQLQLERNYPAGVSLMQAALTSLTASKIVERSVYTFGLAEFQRRSGDAAGANRSYKQCRDLIQTMLTQAPENAQLISGLSQVSLGLGDKEAAVKNAELAVEKLPAAKDAFEGPDFEEKLARVLAHFGEKDRAIALLQHLLVTSYGSPPITPALLRLDPDWDDLRSDPRFEKICQESTK